MSAMTRSLLGRLLGTLLATGLAVACSDHAGPVTPSSTGRISEDATAEGVDVADAGGEIWVAAQDANEIAVVHGLGTIEMIPMPAGRGPHEITFSPSGRYAYVGDLVDGTLSVIRADDRQTVATLAFGPTSGTHQGQPSPDGALVLVSQITSKQLIQVTADEMNEGWTIGASLTLPLAPLCTAFRTDGQRAYVALRPSGIAVVDVPTMTLITILPTDGVVRCGLAPSKDGVSIVVGSNGGGGHLYRLDTSTDVLTDLNATIGAADQQDVDLSPDGRRAYTTSFLTDELKVVNLDDPGSAAASISLDATPGIVDKPDHVVVKGNTVFVTLGATGKLAVLRANHETVTYLDLVPPSTTALHGIAIRPSPSP